MSESIHISIPDKLYEKLDEHVEESPYIETKSELVRHALRDFLEGE